MTDAGFCVLGAGSWGTALAICLARNGLPVTLWGRSDNCLQQMRSVRSNAQYLPGISFPESLNVAEDFSSAVCAHPFTLIAVPSHALEKMLLDLQQLNLRHPRLIIATKGLQPKTGRFFSDVIESIWPGDCDFAFLSGPTFADEVAKGQPSAITLAAGDSDYADQMVQIIHSPLFRVYRSDDLTGVQIAGTVKNVLAIATGIADGLGYGANARSALITRGLNEMMVLGEALGARRETFVGLAGVGDLMLTCTGDLSRNRRFGIALGQGMVIDDALAEVKQVVEGVGNVKELFQLAAKLNVELPITEQVYRIVYHQLAPQMAVQNLLARSPKQE